jgi:LacI family transcriptional regulator
MRAAVSKRNITIRDVAREAEVSIATASRALNGASTVTAEMRVRVIEAARKLRYVPHVGARSLITQRTGMIGVVLPDVYGEFFSEFIRGVDAGARARGYHLFVSGSHGDADEAAEVIHAMYGRVDGMIVMSPHVDESFVAEHLSGDLPVVLMNIRGGAKHRPTINIDNYRGAKLMVQHLYDSGRRRIALITGPKGNFDAEERLRGYRAAITALRLDPGPIIQGDFSEESGREAGRQLAASGALPDAVFALNDMMAIGCLGAFAEAGVSVPEQVAVAGFDDVPIARFVPLGLTTIRVDIARLGSAAFQKLSGAIEGAAEAAASAETLSPELVVRGSTAPSSRGG